MRETLRRFPLVASIGSFVVLAMVFSALGLRAAKHAGAPAGDACGIRPLSIHSAAAGYMLDFRYKVVDADKALPLFDRKLKPYVLDEASGVKLEMPEDTKLGALRASPRNPPVNGKDYYVLFSNRGRSIAKGSKLAVVMGNCTQRNLTLE
jgi:hypothetical protein